MHQDSHGLELTTDSAEAAAKYDQTIRAYLGFSTTTGHLLKQTYAADGDMAMAHIVRGYFFHLFCVPALERKAVQAREAAEASIAARGATEREKLHLAALKAWNAGDMWTANDRWEDILLRWPRDTMAIRLSHFAHFYLTGGGAMRQSIDRIMHAWDDSAPDYGFVLGVASFSHEEAGNYGAAEEFGRRAVDINPKDIWATHAVAHVMEMQGRMRDGIQWLDRYSREWDGSNNFRFHTWWHLSLYHLELEQYDAVLDLYDSQVRGEQTEEYLDVTNGAAMLWRLEQRGVDVGDRWSELADISERHHGDLLLAFADAHYMMALAAAGREDAAHDMLAQMEALPADGAFTQRAIDAEVGLPVCRATLALRNGQAREALDTLLRQRDHIWRLGGSHAQRDIWALMTIEAARKAGDTETAKALLAQRTALHPNSPWSWRQYGEVLDEAGDATAAATARQNAEAALAA
jgi:tetratricopeptide (TPR) repeat protein